MVTGALLSFSLTPVQRFIEAARTVRDLKSGSRLLAHLTCQAYEACTAAGGTPLYPTVSASGVSRKSIPNQFVMIFEDAGKAVSAQTNCEHAVRVRWLEICKTVKKELDSKLKNISPHWATGWDGQVETYWEIKTVVLPPDDAEVKQAHDVFFGEVPPAVGLCQQWKVMQVLFAAAKEVRQFPGDQGIGRHKCALLGDLEQMGPAERELATEFWKGAAGPYGHGLYLNARDRLCAVSLAKRFCALDTELKDLKEPVPDTAAVGTAKWWAEAEAVAGSECTQFANAVGELSKKLGNEAETERRYLLMEDLSAKALARGTQFEGREEQLGELAANLARTRKALPDVGQYAQLGKPPRYFAILALDGDHMGQWLSGDLLRDPNALEESFYQQMSGGLQEYAAQAQQIVTDNEGTLIYAGGDDVLALLPVSTALMCAKKLRDKFPDFATDCSDKTPTASAGVCIPHYMQDLRSGLRAAHDAEKRAKEWGRDALGITLMKRSGAAIPTTMEWGDVASMLTLQKLFEIGVSDRWVYKLRDTVQSIGDALPVEAVKALISHSILRTEMPQSIQEKVLSILEATGEAKQAFCHHVEQIWNETTDSLDRRHGPPMDPAHYPTQADRGFARYALAAFCDRCLTASFFARGSD